MSAKKTEGKKGVVKAKSPKPVRTSKPPKSVKSAKPAKPAKPSRLPAAFRQTGAAMPEKAAPKTAVNKGLPQGVPAGPGIPVLKFLVFIVDWSKSKDVSEVLDESHVRFHFICKGWGTASSDILDLLGIGSTEKAVVVSLEQDRMIPVLLKAVSKKLGLNNPGAGIAFTVPLSGINKPLLKVFKDSIVKIIPKEELAAQGKGKEGKKMAEKKFDLIVIVVNQGFTDELMACARNAGASGGTVINARGLIHKGPVKFFGISVQDEKEVITILSTRSKKVAIMQAVSETYGITSKAKGIVFSLPAEDITGLDLS